MVLPWPQGAWAQPLQPAPLAFAPGKLLRDLARALGSATGGTPRRNGQPRGGRANHDRIHTETYGEGSIRGAERDWGELTPAESEFARDLAQRGFHVRLVPKQRGKRTPDFSVNGLTIELKTLQSFGKRTVQTRLTDAAGQNADIIIINCRHVEANLESIKQQIRSAEAELERSLEGKLIFWMPDGSVVTH